MIETIEPQTLEERLEEAIDIDMTIEGPDGEQTELPSSTQDSIKKSRIASTIAEYICERAPRDSRIEEARLKHGSGDTARPAQMSIVPDDSVSKEELRIMGTRLKQLLDEIFPTKFIIGIHHGFTVDEDGYPDETDQFALFLKYRVQSTGGLQAPAGDSTELL